MRSIAPTSSRPPKVRRCLEFGDLRRLGEHQLACSDALDLQVVGMLMQGDTAAAEKARKGVR